jgi:hypothetical protein
MLQSFSWEDLIVKLADIFFFAICRGIMIVLFSFIPIFIYYILCKFYVFNIAQAELLQGMVIQSSFLMK